MQLSVWAGKNGLSYKAAWRQDMIDALASFCARLYGKRAAKDKAKRALEATEE